MNRRMKRPAAALAVCLLMGVSALAEGSWGQINQPVNRPDNWQRWVESSPFVLGERAEIGEANGQKMFRQSYGSYPSLDGSTVAVPLAMELARQHLGMDESDLPGFVTFSTTHNAYVRLIEGKPNPASKIISEMAVMDEHTPVKLVIATEPSDEELEMAAKAGVVLKKTPICHDAFVFIVNGKNPVEGVKLTDIQKMYTAQIRNWEVFGGKDLPIIPFQREPNSGSQTAMENLVMKGMPMEGVRYNFVSDGMAELIEQIGNYDNGEASIGYSYLYYVENLYKAAEIKPLAIDGVAPTHENIRSGKYPLTTSYYAVHREGDAEGEAFVEWLLSAEGQKCVAQAGYIAVAE